MTLHDEVRRTNDVPIRPVEHQQWRDAHVRPMSAKALGEFRKMAAPDDMADERPLELTLHIMAFITTHCLCDKDGVRVFADNELDWVESNKTAELLEPVANAALRLHGLTEDDEEDRVKN